MANRKYYVVWNGVAPGIYDSWTECQLQIKGYKDARFKAFNSKQEAIEAYRGTPSEHLGLLRSIAPRLRGDSREAPQPDGALFNLAMSPIQGAIAVDGACASNPGPVEYRGVQVGTGRQLFRVGPLQGGTNNAGEYLAIVHALALLQKAGDTTTPVYTDSLTALSWFRHRSHRSKITPTPQNAPLIDLLRRADAWLATNSENIKNPVLKWNTKAWGEIPADFGRKH